MYHESKNPRSHVYEARGAEWLYYFSHRCDCRGHKYLAKIIKRINQFVFHVNIYPEVEIGARLQLPHGGYGVVIHHDVVIGSDAIIFHNVTIANGGAEIGDRVYIGTGAVIIGDINIGDDVVIGANAVVYSDVPDRTMVVSPKAIYKEIEN